MAVDPAFAVNPETEAKARELCFAICQAGGFVDWENGCSTICKSPEQCGGWIPYYTEARDLLKHGASDDQQ